MNKILKALLKFSSADRIKIQEDIKLITERNIGSLNIKKLKGFNNLYRAKRGKARIIFYMDSEDVKIVKLDRRNNNTYQDF